MIQNFSRMVETLVEEPNSFETVFHLNAAFEPLKQQNAKPTIPGSKNFILYDQGRLGENVWSSIRQRDCMAGMAINQT